MNASRNKSLLYLLGLSLVFLCVQFVLAIPLQQKISQQSSQLAQERVKAAIADDQQKTALMTKAEFTQVAPLVAEFETFLIEQDNVLDFITKLESTAQPTGVRLAIQELPPPASEKQSQMQFTIGGRYDALQRYLIELEHLASYVNITHINFAKDTDTSNVTATVQATIYWQ